MTFPAKMDYNEFCCKLIDLRINIDDKFGEEKERYGQRKINENIER